MDIPFFLGQSLQCFLCVYMSVVSSPVDATSNIDTDVLALMSGHRPIQEFSQGSGPFNPVQCPFAGSREARVV
ncbi:hypothetical protein C8Q79DRAFT_971431 [Trametes meyenii]|nr:hypothetical protein C8Q79DRAFT_971431 [Trametes meyenii]